MGGAISGAAGQAWPPFVLVTGLILIGAVVEADGLFAAVGVRIERIGGGPLALLAALLGLEAVVTALLNLDTAAVFVTPIVLHAARSRRVDERPFLYGALFIANGASLLLPGSNLTNLIVLAHSSLSGADVARAMWLPWICVVALTIVFLAAVFRPRREGRGQEPLPPLRLGAGAAATVAATVLIVVLQNAALPVLAIGVVAVAVRRLRPSIGAPVLAGLFVLAVVLGTLARRWHGPASLVRHAGAIGGAAIGAAASVVVNNLPAASLLSAQRPPHPLALLIGLNLGPNLLFTGSLSTYLWYRAARAAGARPSLAQASLLGVVLVPLTIAAALAALRLTDAGAF
ncbi:MAG TPA: SLC13 family permease [Gaiellaceae bacterium]